MTNFAKLMSALAIYSMFLVTGVLVTGCETKQLTQAQPVKQDQKLIAVDVAIAKLGNLEAETQYIGTTAPIREVSIRSRTEGQLLSLKVDVGDPVTQGQVLGQQDDGVLVANVLQTEAELAARQAEVARAKTQVSNAKTQVERSRLELQQAQADAKRLKQLASEGAIAQQLAEQAQTNADTAHQSLKSAQQQVRSQQNEVASFQRRVDAQIAVINQANARLAYTTLTASTQGVVMQKVSEVGNLLQAGDEVLKLGDFSQVKVIVEVSELERSQIRQGQAAIVNLDAFPQQDLSGVVSQISPVADRTSRLIPIEVTIPNRNNQIGSGLLARVIFSNNTSQKILAPDTALRVAGRNNQAKTQIFVISSSEQDGSELLAKARAVKLGAKSDGKVAILSGLEVGDQFITRSGRPLKDGDKVVISALSEKPTSSQNSQKPQK
jgi:HlyD family secretion protein